MVFRNAYFNCETALANLSAAQYLFKTGESSFVSLLILDASRPQHIQQMMWDSLKDASRSLNLIISATSLTKLRIHNYGCASRCSPSWIISSGTNTLLDMGTDFDFFGKLSEPVFEAAVFENR